MYAFSLVGMKVPRWQQRKQTTEMTTTHQVQILQGHSGQNIILLSHTNQQLFGIYTSSGIAHPSTVTQFANKHPTVINSR